MGGGRRGISHGHFQSSSADEEDFLLGRCLMLDFECSSGNFTGVCHVALMGIPRREFFSRLAKCFCILCQRFAPDEGVKVYAAASNKPCSHSLSSAGVQSSELRTRFILLSRQILLPTPYVMLGSTPVKFYTFSLEDQRLFFTYSK